jgi:hypothetical protein
MHFSPFAMIEAGPALIIIFYLLVVATFLSLLWRVVVLLTQIHERLKEVAADLKRRP